MVRCKRRSVACQTIVEAELKQSPIEVQIAEEEDKEIIKADDSELIKA